ncbi:farnesol dehydrogenase-like [Atheta coriaria]|uniref:farnesol dehydrogenase-like n=1 Tax=Dalotia coriaria TaxID=877792 RepID=UPI0031F3483A
MERWIGKVAIVTGASSGIGEVIAEALVKLGMQVVGLARREDVVEANAKRLAALAKNGGKLHGVKCDMTSESDILQAFAWTIKNVGPVHVLVNNAGVLRGNNLIDGDTNKWRQMIDTNFLGLCIATREACKIMMANDIPGHIIHINSITGHYHLHCPSVGIYGATKHAVTNVTDILRQELAGNHSQIKVTSISPGAVKTAIIKDESNSSPQLLAVLKDGPLLESEDILNAVLYVLGTPPRVHINEITLRATGSPC